MSAESYELKKVTIYGQTVAGMAATQTGLWKEILMMDESHFVFLAALTNKMSA